MSCSEKLAALGPNPSVMTITCVSMCLEPLAHLFSFLHHQTLRAWPGVDRDKRSPLFCGSTILHPFELTRVTHVGSTTVPTDLKILQIKL